MGVILGFIYEFIRFCVSQGLGFLRILGLGFRALG